MLEFDSPKEQSSYIKVIGVGGGGSNAVNNMYAQGIQGVDFIVCNTDMKSLNNSPVPNKIILGELGAGNIPEVARKAALEHKDDIRQAIANNTQMLFITAGMGGGTGTGAAPVIAEIAKQIELEDETVKRILVVAIVTVPFSFEGRRRHLQAENGIEELKKHVDSILVINNDKLRQLGNLPFSEAFKQADDVLYTAVKGIAEIITVSAYVNIDFHDVNTVMENSGTALMGAGVGTGENRAMDAIVAASTSVLLNDNDISGAKNILLYFSYSPNYEISMDELGEVTDYITNLTGNYESDVIWGAGADDNLGDELKITLIATGFDKKITGDTGKDTTRVLPLGETEKKEEPKVQIPQSEGDMVIITRDASAQTQQVTEVNPFDQMNARPTEQAPVSPMAAAATTMAAAEVVHQTIAQPIQQPAQQQFTEQVRFAPQSTPQPIAQPEQQSTGHIYTLDGNNVTDFAQQNTAAPTEQHRHNLYEDGINMVQRNQPTNEAPKSFEVPQQSSNIESAVRMKQPVMESLQQPTAEVRQPNYIPLDQVEEKSPEPAILEPILVQSQKETPMAEVAIESAPVDTQVLNETVDTQNPDQAALARARKIEKIRTLHDLLLNKPDGPSIVENMRTEELTNDEIYRAPHSSQSEAQGVTIDRKGNMRSINNFLFGRPD